MHESYMKRHHFECCTACGLGMAHDGAMAFFRFTLEHFVLNVDAIRRQHGLELVVGSPGIAAVLSPDEDLARRAGDLETGLLCQDCAMRSTVFGLLERITERRSVASGTESAEDSAVRPTAPGHASAGEPPREPALPPTPDASEIERFEGEGGRGG